MKLTCERCRKSFVIDDPVAGRVYRIPCRCGHMIVMHFPTASPPPLRARAKPPPRVCRSPPRLRSLPPRPIESPAAAEVHADAASVPSPRAHLRACSDAEVGSCEAAEPEPVFTGDLVLPPDAAPFVSASYAIPDLPAEIGDDPFAEALSAMPDTDGSVAAPKPPPFGEAFVVEAAARLDAIDAHGGDGAAPATPPALATLDPTASPDDREEPRVTGVSFPTGWRAVLALRFAIARDRARMLLRAHGRVLGAASAAAVVFYGVGAWTAAPRGGGAAEMRRASVVPAIVAGADQRASSLPVEALRAATEAAALPPERVVKPRRRGDSGATRAAIARAAGAAPDPARLASGSPASTPSRGEGESLPRAATPAPIPESGAEAAQAASTSRAAAPARLGDSAAPPVPEAEHDAHAEAKPELAATVSAKAVPDPAAASPATAPGAPEARSAEPAAAPAPAYGAAPASPDVAVPPAESPAEAERAAQPAPTIAAPEAVSTGTAVAAAVPDGQRAAVEDR